MALVLVCVPLVAQPSDRFSNPPSGDSTLRFTAEVVVELQGPSVPPAWGRSPAPPLAGPCKLSWDVS